MWKKQSLFWELRYWKDLDALHSIDVMHIKMNVCESLLGTLLNTDRKTRDHGHARADLKKIGIRPELWLDDLVKGTKLSTSCITLSKHEKKEFCGFLKNMKIPSDYSTNISRLISLPDLKKIFNKIFTTGSSYPPANGCQWARDARHRRTVWSTSY
jgi:hypothetical protein